MNTPTTRDFLRRPDATRRRSARQALAVIPNVTSSTFSPGEALAIDVTAMDNLLNSQTGSDGWSPAPSPDEMVIQKRGRRRRTIVWSPDLDTCKRNSLFSLSSRDRTPVKSPSKSNMVLRSTPRKRLVLGESSESQFTTPEKKKKQQTITAATINTHKQFNGSLVNGLLGLSHNQLVQMIMDLVSMQEQGLLCEADKLRNILLQKMPVADIQSQIDKLKDLRQNVYACLVSTNLDDTAYNRAHIHLDAFQTAVIEQGRKLLESQHWISLMQYICAAWKLIKELPQWENKNLHNVGKKCFKSLTHLCIQALRKGNFTDDELNIFYDRIEAMIADCEDIKVCLVLLNDLKQNAN